MKTLRLGICGLGTVASGVVNVLNRNRDLITSRAGCSIEIVQIASRRKKDNCDLTGIDFTTDLDAVVNNPDIDVVLELIGGYETARTVVESALKAGKHVVTANKALIAEHGNELFALARENGVSIGYEAGVAGGIPVIKALREGLTANAITSLAGIINGTGNFILTEMKDKGRAFEDVLAEAQALGYAEADPTFDVEGIDAAHKLTILASCAFGMPLQFDKTFTEGISNLSTFDVKHAAELGYVIKHLGIACKRENGVEVRVHPTLVADDELIARVDGVMNAVLVNGDAVGKTLYYGAGAGSEATASAVLADVIDIAREYASGVAGVVPSLAFTDELLNDLPVLPIDEAVCPFYLRIMVDDSPGTLAKISSVMSEHGINIESVAQNEAEQVGDVIPLIIMTHEVSESLMNKAISAIEALESTQGSIVKIRVAQF
ncbi:homoserine dehydrogenase [Oleiphilus sp. HI0071]|uniref:homoserine dehydrogenase n=1 Tax=unclassified Oleiphilus TaxID=2631174 RepID=UPI0007C38EF5|nr:MULTISPECIES: homoserine dehydrogenase [unclassified Oleiphilus]KZY70175.1 homoserine dehydrogenase [Oleiphilus sp. HI0065]KZY83416.1 homoserine dehydrogenase [Oleiphilus sp. HI0071]KZY91329.1 homoserine dehydrogenase [Oleiphilus sp. HI0073]KZZ42367.1 homoserine dehydrogenase [Oleiphilus sp. HI0118]KZZ60475.1 homoserine dehydrogenase [Oleiphilus sp. HI0122]KZZ71317.1 homoserine dehydrogenase [Oleiphilus sp. HI0130]KZZ82137.1 homoserine dehydrogenase [Oleiphilus sp. HI0133]